MRHYFIKNGAPVWIHVPGTPLALPGFLDTHRRITSGTTKEAAHKLGQTEQPPLPVAEGVLEGDSNGQEDGLLASQDKEPAESDRGILAGVDLQQLLEQNAPVLNGLPLETASSPVPIVATMNTTGE